MSAVKYLDTKALIEVLPWPALINALDSIFTQKVEEPVRHHHTMSVPNETDATLLLMPAWIEGKYIGVKQVAVFPGNAERGEPGLNGSYLLSSAKTGKPLLQLDANELTPRRTAAASALASRYLSRADSKILLMMGAGRMANALIDAHRAVRPINTVYVWNRHDNSAHRLAHTLNTRGINALVCSDAELPEISGQADIISCATMATEPILLGKWLQPGVHVDLVGAFRPNMRETDDEAIQKAAVFVDTRASALVEGGDLTQAMDSGAFSAQDVLAEFSQLCTGLHTGREALENSTKAITLFKSVGAAREDLAAAILAFEAS